MEELNLLEHSTYNVEKIRKNKEFFNMLIGKIKSTYQLFSYNEKDWQNQKNIDFAPTTSRIPNVFIEMSVNGEISFTFNVSRSSNIEKLQQLKDKYNVYSWTYHTSLKIKNVNSENYREHLPNIVKGIEFCEYSFR